MYQAPTAEPTFVAQMDLPFKQAKQRLLDRFERTYLVAQLEAHHMNVSATSRSIGMSRKHLRELMEKHGLALERRLTER